MEDRPPTTSRPEKDQDRLRLVDPDDKRGKRIKVVGVGGAGGNALDNMIRESRAGVEFITANTDLRALEAALAPTRLQMGPSLTKGRGAGADPEVGRSSATESHQEISQHLAGADMCSTPPV